MDIGAIERETEKMNRNYLCGKMNIEALDTTAA